MSPQRGPLALVMLLLVLAAFVWLTSASLPQVVASHFGAGGAANGVMPRGTYRALMLVLIVGVPLLVGVLPAAMAGRGGANLNIPHRAYWLAPERRQETVAFVAAHGRWFAAVVALFLSYVHWLVVQANQLQPPVLTTTGLTVGLALFFLLLAVWLVALFARFRRPA